VAVGAGSDLAPLADAARQTVDLGGRVVLPGPNDSHIHAMRAGLDWERTLHWEDLRTVRVGRRHLRDRPGSPVSRPSAEPRAPLRPRWYRGDQQSGTGRHASGKRGLVS
jgi:Amidohydrolase family